MEKIIIYQVFTRLFGNRNLTRKAWGTVAENGCGKFADIDESVLKQLKLLGATAVWYTGVVRHASQTDHSASGIPTQHAVVVKGKAGSPYAVTDYYDVDPDLATDISNRMEEWEALIARTHLAGLDVIMDFVPNHVAREYRSICRPEGVRDLGEDDETEKHFSCSNNFYYCWGQPLDLSEIASGAEESYQEQPARATGNDRFDARPGKNDWYETVKLNYGIDYCDAGGRSEHFDPIPNTWLKMTDILLFWASKGVDGFRCDMAEMVPPQFWSYATARVKALYPELKFIGEVYNPALYTTYLSSGFDLLYDKVGMYDCLRDIVCGHRPASDISRQWQQTNEFRDHMLYFLENHDEQRIASDFFCGHAKAAVPAHIVACLLGKNSYMLYAGQEFGERGMDNEGFSGVDGRTTIFDYWALESLQRGYFKTGRLRKEESELRESYRKVMRMATEERVFTDGEMFDLMYVNPQLANRQYAFLRRTDEALALVVVNFSASDVCAEVRIPRHAFEFLKIEEAEVDATDLLSGDRTRLGLKADELLTIQLPAYGGVIYKMQLP